LPRQDAATLERRYRRLTELLGHVPGLRAEDVMVVITTPQADDWSFGAGLATLVDHD
jgi:phenylpyruvate tautomerase PptA (4-oxalocrotonate tautomerase family)